MTPEPDDGGIRCLIADDQAMVREGFAAMLAAEPGIKVTGQAIDGADAVRQARRLSPDVVLMDVRMPVMDGLEAARQILTATCGADKPRVLMLTTFDLDEYVYEALRAGASGFLLKDATTAELIRAVQVVAAGDALLAPSVTRRLIADFTRKLPAKALSSTALDTLTSRETEVLGLIGQGLSNAEISDVLCIAAETTKTHVKRILAKLGLRDRAQAVMMAYETGLVTPGGLQSPTTLPLPGSAPMRGCAASATRSVQPSAHPPSRSARDGPTDTGDSRRRTSRTRHRAGHCVRVIWR
jgi:DNA-binding NarL/FixJ family response regulator